MDFWRTARSFAEEAAKKSQGLAASNLSDVVLEASKRSKELAAEASKKSKEFAAEVLKRADQITAQIPPPASVLTNLVDAQKNDNNEPDLEKFGVTDGLREFVKGITTDTFRNFPVEDDSEVIDIPMVANVRQDLTEWQEKHAKLVLSTVKEISKLRYQLCPRVMKERMFWRIYFNLVYTHIAPYEKRYMEEVKLKAAEKAKSDAVKESSPNVRSEKADEISRPTSNNLKSSDKDLDVFLLGDEDEIDNGPEDLDGSIDEDLDKL